MISLGSDEIKGVDYQGPHKKAYLGTDLVWEKEKKIQNWKVGDLVYKNEGSSRYIIQVNKYSPIRQGHTYLLRCNCGGLEMYCSEWGDIKNGDIFGLYKSGELKILNRSYERFKIWIYESDKRATVVV